MNSNPHPLYRIFIVCALSLPVFTHAGCAAGIKGNEARRPFIDTGITTFDGQNREIKINLGPKSDLIPDGKFGLHYIPDQAVVVLKTRSALRMLIASGDSSTYLLEGADPLNFTTAKKVLSNGPPGSFDNGYAGIGGIYCRGPVKLYAFYHAEDQESLGTVNLPGSNIRGFYCRVGVAVSADEGKSWSKLGPIVSSQKPKEFHLYDGQNDRGAGEPGAVVDPTGRYLYLFYTEHSRVDDRGVQICLARVDVGATDPVPGSAIKFYNGSFSKPGLSGEDTPVFSAKNMDSAEAMFPHVVYSSCLGMYVMIMNINFWKEYYFPNRTLEKSGIYVSYSSDAIHWSAPYLLVKDYAVPLNGKTLSWQGTIVWDPGSQNKGWLAYGYSPSYGWGGGGTKPYYLVGRRIEFSIKN